MSNEGKSSMGEDTNKNVKHVHGGNVNLIGKQTIYQNSVDPALLQTCLLNSKSPSP